MSHNYIAAATVADDDDDDDNNNNNKEQEWQYSFRVRSLYDKTTLLSSLLLLLQLLEK